jgi:hypothetical protein
MNRIFFDVNVGKAILKIAKIAPKFLMIEYRGD